ncbi:MAG: hypothetical protein Q7K41_03690 [Dehalococcoidales bacterium]|nr:hypothetical protein [Dehalococcoidales bacterium]
MFAALTPIALVGRYPELLGGAGSLDRYTLPAMMGVSLFAVGAVYALVRSSLRVWVLAVLVGLSIATQISNANVYREDWKVQRDLWWQLSWRAPELEPGAVLVVHDPGPSGPPADYQIWGAANLYYYPAITEPVLWGLPLIERTGQTIRAAQTRDKVIRKVTFKADTNMSLVLTVPSDSSCLHVLDGDRLELPLDANSLLRSVAQFSHVSQIRADASSVAPPVDVFGKEPARGWCYYFEKADLARQVEDWPRIAQLGNETLRLGLRPTDVTEYLPFVEGYANAGQFNEAKQWVGLAIQGLPRTQAYDEAKANAVGLPILRQGLCGLVDRLGRLKSQDPARLSFIAEVGAQVTCSSR